MSLLEQEEGHWAEAEENLLKALEIVKANQSGFEIAVTYANLANTAILATDYEKAKDYAKRAIQCFRKRNLYDAHYCAALSALATCHFQAGEYE
ncbi:MAG: tetratricopeptide repeat protein, partial [Lachnospiraceae bacterium]|nr:tetratricopeptide repeat protein [Lachnospiraceae bacterium]